MDTEGYDSSLFIDQELVQGYLCSICLGVLNNPVVTPNGCEFCLSCANKGIASKSDQHFKCVKCFSEVLTDDKLNFSKRSRDSVNGFTVKCPNSKIDALCTWKGTVLNLNAHISICPVAILPCQHYRMMCCFDECNGQVLRRDLELHQIAALSTLKVTELSDHNAFYRNEMHDMRIDTAMKLDELQSLKEGNIVLRSMNAQLLKQIEENSQRTELMRRQHQTKQQEYASKHSEWEAAFVDLERTHFAEMSKLARSYETAQYATRHVQQGGFGTSYDNSGTTDQADNSYSTIASENEYSETQHNDARGYATPLSTVEDANFNTIRKTLQSVSSVIVKSGSNNGSVKKTAHSFKLPRIDSGK